jgi:sulfur-carrier protein
MADTVITVRYFAGARAAAGVPEEALTDRVLPGGATLAQLVKVLGERHGQRLTTVLSAASFLVDGVSWRDHDRELPAGAVIDVLPPFAGG